MRYTSNSEIIKQNILNKEKSNNNNYLNNFNDLTFMNNNWYSPYKMDIYNTDNPIENKFINKECGILNNSNGNYINIMIYLFV